MEVQSFIQLVVDDNLIAEGNKIKFFHHGKIAVGNMGSGKVDEYRDYVKANRGKK